MAEEKLFRHPYTKGDYEAAEAYIAAEKSDPFARARVYTHIRNGMSGFHWNNAGTLVDARYSAKPQTETVTVTGRDGWPVTFDRVVYTQRTRP